MPIPRLDGFIGVSPMVNGASFTANNGIGGKEERLISYGYSFLSNSYASSRSSNYVNISRIRLLRYWN